jgi:hypothetical protein
MVETTQRYQSYHQMQELVTIQVQCQMLEQDVNLTLLIS